MKTPWELLKESKTKIKTYLEDRVRIGAGAGITDPSSGDAVGYSES